jgi:hypothetical protein
MSSHLVVPPQRPLSRERLERRKRHLVSEIAGARAAPAAPRSRRPWLVTAAGAATAATAAAVFLGTDSSGDGTASAATVLRQAAVATRAQPTPPRPGPGEYLYVKSESAYLSVFPEDMFAVLVPRVREMWVGPEGGRMRETSGEPKFLSERDRERWIAAGRPDLSEPVWGGAVEAPPALDLPSDPDALYARLEAQSEGHPEGVHEEMFTLLGDALRDTMLRYMTATPAQRAALYEVAARIPGVELVGRVTDPTGRTGVAVAMSSTADGLRHMLVLNADTGELLSEEQRVLEENEFGYPAGTLIGYATYVTSAVVDSNRERPRA